MAHIPLPVIIAVFTVACAAMIVIRYQLPKPDWMDKDWKYVICTGRGEYQMAIIPSYNQVKHLNKAIPNGIKGVKLKQSKLPPELLATSPINQQLIGVDPFDPNLTQEQKEMIIQEAAKNPAYYFSTIVRVPANECRPLSA